MEIYSDWQMRFQNVNMNTIRDWKRRKSPVKWKIKSNFLPNKRIYFQHYAK